MDGLSDPAEILGCSRGGDLLRYPPSHFNAPPPSPPPQGSARVIRCLVDQRNKLSSTCRAVLFDEEVRGPGGGGRTEGLSSQL